MLGAGGSNFSGIMGSSTAKKQASAICEAAEIARKPALKMDDKTRGDVAPFRQFWRISSLTSSTARPRSTGTTGTQGE